MSPNCEPTADEAEARRESVLVVEDEVLVRTAVATHLREAGFRVIEAIDAEEALLALIAEPAIGLVFSDVNMPGDMDGEALARWLKQERPGIRTVLTTGAGWGSGNGSLENVIRLSKPYSFTDIERLVKSLLGVA